MLNPGPRDGQKPVVEDGDPNNPPEAPAPVDGVLDVPEPALVEDGADTPRSSIRATRTTSLTSRTHRRRPILSSIKIEDLDPVRDNRATLQLYQNEPYDPVGVQIGRFVLFPELEVGGSYYSNVFHAPNAESDVALDVIPSARLVSNGSRTRSNSAESAG